MIFSWAFYLSRSLLTIWSLLQFNVHFRIFFSMKNFVSIFICTTLSIYIALCRKVMFMVLIFTSCDYWSSFHFLVSSQSLSSEIYSFNCRGLSPCLYSFLLYFFEATMSGSVYMIYFSVNLLVLYRKSYYFLWIDFFILSLCWNSFIYLSYLLVSSLNSFNFDDIYDFFLNSVSWSLLCSSHWRKFP